MVIRSNGAASARVTPSIASMSPTESERCRADAIIGSPPWGGLRRSFAAPAAAPRSEPREVRALVSDCLVAEPDRLGGKHGEGHGVQVLRRPGSGERPCDAVLGRE